MLITMHHMHAGQLWTQLLNRLPQRLHHVNEQVLIAVTSTGGLSCQVDSCTWYAWIALATCTHRRMYQKVPL